MKQLYKKIYLSSFLVITIHSKINTLYTTLHANDLVFDVGAHYGSKTDGYLARECRVVCIEPQTSCLSVLYKKYKDNPHVTIFPYGVSDHEGVVTFYESTASPTISTCFSDWRKGRFATGYKWDKKVEISVTTLDRAIELFGLPAFCKIDVEGYEYSVIKGLSKKIPLISFEFTQEFVKECEKCLVHLCELGYTKFNLCEGENKFYRFEDWVDAQTVVDYIARSPNKLIWGDVYAAL